jgi:hypothetical protein
MTRPIWLVVIALLGGACDVTTVHAVGDVVERESRANSLPARSSQSAAEPSSRTSVEPSSRPAIEPSSRSCKVEPPIVVTLTSTPVAGDRYELVATATPTKAVDSIDLAFVVPPGATITKRADSFAATPAGMSRTLVATITTTARTTELSAFARIPFAGVTMSRAATISVGDPLPVARIQQYTLPDGELVREVRP